MENKKIRTVPRPVWRRNAAFFLISQCITLLGSSVVQMAIIWKVALETSSGLWVTLLTLSATVPQTVLSFFGGVWADRYPRKRLIILADAMTAAVTLVLALLIMRGTAAGLLPAILVVSALRSVGAGIQTPAVSASIAQIVPEEHLMRYNGMSGSMLAIVQFAAPAAAGALLAAGPFHWVLLVDVATAVVGIFLLSFVALRHTKSEGQAPEPFLAGMRAGISYAARDRVARRVLLIFGAFIFLCVPSGFLTVLMIERTFGDSYTLLTISEMAGFAGMVLGGLVLGIWGGFKERRKTLFGGLFVYGLLSLALGLTGVFGLFAVLLFLMSVCIPMVQSSVTTMLQEHVPEEKQGRVFGLLGAMYSGGMPLGMLLFGPLSDHVRIQTLVLVCGIAMLVLAAFAYFGRDDIPAGRET